MAIIYYYILNNDKEKIKDGINLSSFCQKIISINDHRLRCIFGYLNPNDFEDVNKTNYTCLELEVDTDSCYVLNGDLEALKDSDAYNNSIIPLSKYEFGIYRNPKVAIVNDITFSQIKEFEDKKGSPILFDNSNSIYKSCVFEEFRQKYGDFDETMLAIFFMLMSHKGKFKLLEKKLLENQKTLYIYQDNETQKIFTYSIKEG